MDCVLAFVPTKISKNGIFNALQQWLKTWETGKEGVPPFLPPCPAVLYSSRSRGDEEKTNKMIHEICIKFAYNLAFPQEKNYSGQNILRRKRREGRRKDKNEAKIYAPGIREKVNGALLRTAAAAVASPFPSHRTEPPRRRHNAPSVS